MEQKLLILVSGMENLYFELLDRTVLKNTILVQVSFT